MNVFLPVFQTPLARIQLATIVFALIAPQIAFAEISDESLLGLGLRARPAYDGSASQSVELVPVVRYFGQPWFVRSTQGVFEGGVWTALAPGLHAGAQLAYESGRKASESDFLKNHNISDVNIGASIGTYLEWDHKFGPMPITLLARARQRLDSDRGVQADLRLSLGVYSNGRVAAGVFTQATWANAKSAGSFYGISPQQDNAIGLSAFRAGSGLLLSSVGLLWSVDLNRNWTVVGSMESRHLHGDAVRSPLAERESNYYASAGIAYRF